jgi:DNA modification methylase
MIGEYLNKFWNADSFKFLPDLPDKSVDLILTDPPYDFDEEKKLFLHREFNRISKGAIIVFSPPENQWILPAKQYLFWIKPISTKNTSRSYSRFVEIIFVYGSGTWNSDRHWSNYTNVFTDIVDDAKLHPFRKPPSMISRLVQNHSNKGDIILDPFCGSGVVADVASYLERNFIAVDKVAF